MALETSWLGAAGGQGCVFLAWWSLWIGRTLAGELSGGEGSSLREASEKRHGVFRGVP